jgi:outer membrane protein assembly factor BamB
VSRAQVGLEASAGTGIPDQAAVAVATPAPPGNDWTQYRSDVSGTGDNSENLISSINVGQLRTAWVAGFFAGHPFESTPAVVNNVVYVANGNSLFAIDLTTGAKLWEYDDPPQSRGYLSSSVAVDPRSGIAYYGSPDGRLYAVNTATHQLAWQSTLGATSAGAYIWSSPLLANGKVYIGLSSFNDHPCVRGAVIALDPATGAHLWEHYFVPAGELGGAVWSSVTADPATSTLLVATGNPCSPPADQPVQGGISDDQQDAIVGLNWDTGALRWYYTAIGNDACDCDFGEGPVSYVFHGQRYVVAGNKLGVVYAVTPPASGSSAPLAWSDTIASIGPAPGGGIFTPPAYKDGLVYVAGGPSLDNVCHTGALWALRADSGAVAWRQCTAGEIVGAPSITGNVIFAGQANSVVAYDATTGQVLWQQQTPGEVWGGVNISQGNVLVVTTAGKLWCFRLRQAPK